MSQDEEIILTWTPTDKNAVITINSFPFPDGEALELRGVARRGYHLFLPEKSGGELPKIEKAFGLWAGQIMAKVERRIVVAFERTRIEEHDGFYFIVPLRHDLVSADTDGDTLHEFPFDHTVFTARSQLGTYHFRMDIPDGNVEDVRQSLIAWAEGLEFVYLYWDELVATDDPKHTLRISL